MSMPRSMAWLLLILALTGPLLTHAEAADDLARTLVGETEEGAIAIEDGGVGDDPVVASDWPVGPSVEYLGAADGSPLWIEETPERPADAVDRVVAEPLRWPSGDLRAWLQVFRD